MKWSLCIFLYLDFLLVGLQIKLLIINYTEVCTLSLFDEGKEASSGGGIYRLVDVRDVANAHILAFEVPSANGRYCLVEANGYSSLVLKILQKFNPSIQGRTYSGSSGFI
ncbi:hypothetical protein MTR67_004168 [Solanum verrucosum]|uniref:Uncharacterized protein n=1 Tax=Solanum verrucosum TaxID=315347 RepID=A0AAF0PTL4_SOLVR|nr:hypothetical protein MTR67_004168 [Solanum verrucosum]